MNVTMLRELLSEYQDHAEVQISICHDEGVMRVPLQKIKEDEERNTCPTCNHTKCIDFVVLRGSV